LCQVSRGFAEAGAGDVVVDVLVDGTQGLPEWRAKTGSTRIATAGMQNHSVVRGAPRDPCPSAT